MTDVSSTSSSDDEQAQRMEVSVQLVPVMLIEETDDVYNTNESSVTILIKTQKHNYTITHIYHSCSKVVWWLGW